MTSNYLSNNAAKSHIARNNSILESAWPPKSINMVKILETSANWLFLSKNKSANKYTFPTSKNKLCLKKIIQLWKIYKQQILAKSTINIFSQGAFYAWLFLSFFVNIKQTLHFKIFTAPHRNIFYLLKK